MTDLLKQKFWTVTEVAEYLRISKMTVYRLIQTAELDSTRVGGNYRITEESLREYLGKDSLK